MSRKGGRVIRPRCAASRNFRIEVFNTASNSTNISCDHNNSLAMEVNPEELLSIKNVKTGDEKHTRVVKPHISGKKKKGRKFVTSSLLALTSFTAVARRPTFQRSA
jgi:hypothetical protein